MLWLRKATTGLCMRRFRVPRDAVRWAVKKHADRIAVATSAGERLTFADLGRHVFELAAGMLARGLKPGDRVAFLLRNTPEFVEVRLACHEAGLVAAPMIWDLSPEARAAVMNEIDARLYIHDPELDPNPVAGKADLIPAPAGHPAALRRLMKKGAGPVNAPIDPASPAAVNFTSGTTGRPKGALSTHRAWMESLRMMVAAAEPISGEPEAMLHGIPLAAAGWGPVLPCLLGGITSLLMRECDPSQALEFVERERATRALLTPSQLIDWLDDSSLERRNLSSLRAIVCGTAPMPGAKAREILTRLGPVLQQGYGLAEVLPPLALLKAAEHDPEKRPFRAGRVQRGVRVRILDGEGKEAPVGKRGMVEVRSPTQTAGYLNRPDLNAAAFRDGFFRTGDIGFTDEAGYLNIVGRASEAIPGWEEHPRDVEESAHGCAAVKECALVSMEGQAVLVYSVRRGMKLEAEELRSFLTAQHRGRLPDRLLRLDGDLPRSAAGKIARGRLVLR